MKMKSVAEIAEGLHKGREKMMEKLNLPDKFAQGTATAMIQKYDTMLDNLALEQDMIRESKQGISGKTPMQMGKYGGMFKKYQLGGGDDELNINYDTPSSSGFMGFDPKPMDFVGQLRSLIYPNQRAKAYPNEIGIGGKPNSESWWLNRPWKNKDKYMWPELKTQESNPGSSNLGSMNDFESIRNWTNETFGQKPVEIGSSYKGTELGKVPNEEIAIPPAQTVLPIEKSYAFPADSVSLETFLNRKPRLNLSEKSIPNSSLDNDISFGRYNSETNKIDFNRRDVKAYNKRLSPEEQDMRISTKELKADENFNFESRLPETMEKISSSLLPLADNIVNYALTRKAAKDPLPTPTYRKYAAMNPTVDVEAQRKDVNENQQSMNRSIDRSVSGPAALAAKMAARSQSVGALNSIEQEKRMQERATQNQNRQGYQDVANANAGLLDNYRNMQYAKRQEIRGTDSENVTNAVSDLLQMKQDDVARELDMDKMMMIMQAYDKRIISRNAFDLLSPEMQKRLTELGIKVEG